MHIDWISIHWNILHIPSGTFITYYNKSEDDYKVLKYKFKIFAVIALHLKLRASIYITTLDADDNPVKVKEFTKNEFVVATNSSIAVQP